MEKLFICSDVHGDYIAFKTFIEKTELNPIIICGDLAPYSQNFSYLFSSIDNDLFLVKGNCDNAYDFSIANIYIPPRIRIESFFNKKFVITHGDLIKDPSSSGISMTTGDFFISGHTHVAKLFVDDNGIVYLNPGSLSKPRGHHNSSYAIIYKNRVEIRALESDKLIFELDN